jgi:hypothetical protein
MRIDRGICGPWRLAKAWCLLDLVFEIWESEKRNTKSEKERAQPGFIAQSAMEKRLAVPPNMGLKTETPRWWRGAVLNGNIISQLCYEAN